MGKNVDGLWERRLTSWKSARLAARMASVRDIMEFLNAKGQVGYPPIITAAAQLGYSLMASRSAEIQLGLRGGEGSIVMRLGGSCARIRAR